MLCLPWVDGASIRWVELPAEPGGPQTRLCVFTRLFLAGVGSLLVHGGGRSDLYVCDVFLWGSPRAVRLVPWP